MESVQTGKRFDSPPRWATLERRIIDFMNDGADPFLENYVNDDGSLQWPADEEYVGIDGHDDAYEGFYNWPLFYAMGGGERYLDTSLQQYDAIIEQFSQVDTPFGHPMAVKEYEQCRDWFHHGEGNLFFYNLGLADPSNQKNIDRAERFAGFYMNEDPEVRNYDPENRIIKAPMTGSMGPEYCDFSAFPHHTYGADYNWGERRGLPFQDMPGIDTIDDITDPENEEKLYEIINERCSRGDVPLNLAVTGLMTNAYLYTGDEKYREWIREYVEAWEERIEENNGIVPDNVGLSGEIGEYIDRKWYGGFYGWTWVGWHGIGAALTIAAENSMLVERGDSSHLEMLRSQLELLVENGIVKESPVDSSRTLHIPHCYGDPGNYDYDGSGNPLRNDDGSVYWDDGWFEFSPMRDTSYPTHLWYMSLEDEDESRLEHLKESSPQDTDYVLPDEFLEYTGHEYSWFEYLNGEFEEYPERILEANLHHSKDRIRLIQREEGENVIENYDSNKAAAHYLHSRNPIVEEGLLQLTMGAPLQVYNGGLIMARVRHYDWERKRPGLPENVAALVSGFDEKTTDLDVVNTGAKSREMVIQAGAYGEHDINALEYEEENESLERRSVGDNHFKLTIPAKTKTSLRLDVERFSNKPAYTFPWDDS